MTPAGSSGLGPASVPAEMTVPDRRPVGVLAALFAIALTIAWLFHYQATALDYASGFVRALGPQSLPAKAQTLTLQRAALRHADVLPIFGTSELYCCGTPFNAGQMFYNAPTGFAVFNVGYPVTEDLFFAEDFGALGHDLSGKKLVVSDSAWFTAPSGIDAKSYAHTFSPEIAQVFVFDAPVPLPLRAAVARRMLAFPATVSTMPVLRAGLWALARGGWRGQATYALLDPIGRLDAWVAQLEEARQTTRTLYDLAHPKKHPTPDLKAALRSPLRPAPQGPLARIVSGRPNSKPQQPPLWQLLAKAPAAPAAKPLNRNVPDKPQSIPWNADLTKGTALASQQSASNPFGITDDRWRKCSDIQPGGFCKSALLLYRAGWDNHSGTVYSEPADFVHGEIVTPAWTDLDLEFQTLRAVGADPLAWVQPLQGLYSDYTPYSASVRAVMYDRYLAIAHAAGITATTFQTHDDDPLFVDSFGHLSPRGWVYADRLLDLFWHGQLAEIQGELQVGGSTDLLFPAALNCRKPIYCRGVGDVPLPRNALSDLPTGIPRVPLPQPPAPAPKTAPASSALPASR